MPGNDLQWHRLDQPERFVEGQVRPVLVANVLLAIGRTKQGLFVLDGVCPHAGAVLGRGRIEGNTLLCPRHGFAFQTSDGSCLDSRECSVVAHPVQTRDGVILIGLPPGEASRAEPAP